MSRRTVGQLALWALLPGSFLVALTATATANDQATGPMLRLANGGYVTGELSPSEGAASVSWRSPRFTQPFTFPVSSLHAIQFPAPGQPAKPKGKYCFELVDDDLLYGNLLGMTEAGLEVDAPGLGRLELRRERVGRFYRLQGADSIYLGPNGLPGWKDAAATPQWRDEGGTLSSEQPGATLFANLGIPEKAMIEIELAWKRKPNFVFALGVEEKAEAGQNAFQIEVWDNEVVVVAESSRDADLAAVQQLGAEAGQVCIQAYLDQKAGKLSLLSRSGKFIATLNVDATKAKVRPGVRLTNKKGDVRLERLRITHWNGVVPRGVQKDEARVHRTDGTIVYGRLTAYDPAAKQFTVHDGTTETVVKQDAVTDLFLSSSSAKGATDPLAGAKNRTLRVVQADGTRLSGTIIRIDDRHVGLLCPSIEAPVGLPLAELRALIALRGEGTAAATPPAAPAGRAGRLLMDGVSLVGRLGDGNDQAGASCLVWHPDLATNASPLTLGSSGRIVYREVPVRGQQPAQPVNKAIGGAMRVAPPLPPPQPPPAEATTARSNQGVVTASAQQRRSLHLRSGDTIPCDVTGIDEKGVSFKTQLSDATFVPHEKIKCVELLAANAGPRLDDPKRGRLLTLPRLQKDIPPTHLVCARNGDFLRGRILEMDDKRLKIEVRLDVKEIPRDLIAQIIWLHPDELADDKTTVSPVDKAQANRVQIQRDGGNRMTFVADKVTGGVISGISDVLGACRADVAQVDQLLFGDFIERSAAQLAYHLWKLQHAIEPKFVQAENDAATETPLAGTESPLVGQPGFAFRLDGLDGKKIQLADYKGKFLVVEFWATWCGPCLQTMPLVEGVVKDFADRNVELLTINLEEQAPQIKSLLERHKLQPRVALDRDGTVAAKYGVTAIPQTVVIDRDGKVARLFVGGGKKTAESLRKALEELTAAKE